GRLTKTDKNTVSRVRREKAANGDFTITTDRIERSGRRARGRKPGAALAPRPAKPAAHRDEKIVAKAEAIRSRISINEILEDLNLWLDRRWTDYCDYERNMVIAELKMAIQFIESMSSDVETATKLVAEDNGDFTYGGQFAPGTKIGERLS